ncbi:uncharacterized protein BT62DRAFT_999347 [Guyanagaster necrorhizus]|uniref:Transmembrane protein n=1 Tax=Guyanagaster necrorhizus TaxID=856835 RepID=A0A9P8B0M8_9AGAR|nr:uncharacterized protein BT62DRAFT_999347 [Guyanagaster necrorhizus MCA 3950]KAG7453292.1 hypothetical protein BT62DRAFT_999347 [Guyanagaster necrorhizus MCA 3950]
MWLSGNHHECECVAVDDRSHHVDLRHSHSDTDNGDLDHDIVVDLGGYSNLDDLDSFDDLNVVFVDYINNEHYWHDIQHHFVDDCYHFVYHLEYGDYLDSSSTSEIITTNDTGGITTVTTVIPITSSTGAATGSSAAAAAASSSSSSSSGGFWNNKGAVAGVFTVVGLIGVALLVVLVTTTIRRRRARQFDQELAEAAAAAPGPVPVYLDDDDDFPTRNKMVGGGGGFSDASSHGTYAQNPMSTESYGMSEIPAATDYGQAGIGVSRTRSMGGLPGAGGWLNAGEGASPYPVFMQAGAPQHPGYYTDVNNTVPVAPQAAYGAYGEPLYPERQQSPPQSYPDTTTSDLSRQGSQSLLSTATSPTSPGESYASHYQPGFVLPNSYEGGQQPQPELDDGRPKILKVANE